MNKRLIAIRKEIEEMHKNSNEEYIREWFFDGHVKIVAEYAEKIAKEVGANVEVSVLAALFHDVARCWGIDKDPELMEESLEKTEEIMKKYNYPKSTIEKVKKAIMHHNCRDRLPDTKEGKVMATADAMSHFMTDFYFIMPFRGWLKCASTIDGYKKWAEEKIEREFKRKIFYEKYKKEAKSRYLAFKTLFKEHNERTKRKKY